MSHEAAIEFGRTLATSSNLTVLSLRSSLCSAVTPEEIYARYTAFHPGYDAWMFTLLSALIATVINTEVTQSGLCERQAYVALQDDPSSLNIAFATWAVFMAKLRRNVLAPITVATCPILAIEEGLDAVHMALNVMAILFVFDFDDAMFNHLLSKPQKAYVESVEIPVDAASYKFASLRGIAVVVVVVVAKLLPVLLFHPESFHQPAGVDEKWDGFKGGWGEPAYSPLFIAWLSFSTLDAVDIVFRTGQLYVKGAGRGFTRSDWFYLVIQAACFVGASALCKATLEMLAGIANEIWEAANPEQR